MERFQYRISNKEICPLDELSIFSSRIYIVVFHAHKIPPHLGVIANGSFYSWKASGSDIDLSVDKILKLVDRKNIATLILDIGEANIDQNVKEVFTSFDRIIEGMTCLTPINQLLLGYDIHEKIGDLLKDDRCNVQTIYGTNLPTNFGGILNYSRNDINERIRTLQNG